MVLSNYVKIEETQNKYGMHDKLNAHWESLFNTAHDIEPMQAEQLMNRVAGLGALGMVHRTFYMQQVIWCSK